MRSRWLRIGLLAATLFAINAIIRLVGRLGYGDGTAADQAMHDRLAWIGWGAMALTAAAVAGWWARQRPPGEAAGELAGAAAVAGLLYVVVGPFISAPPRFEDGVGGAIVQLAIYLGVAGVGALIGMLLMIAAGLDYRSQALKRFEESRAGKPRRPVRR